MLIVFTVLFALTELGGFLMNRNVARLLTVLATVVILMVCLNSGQAGTVSLRSGGYFCGTDGTCMWFKPGDPNWLFERFTYVMGYADCPQNISDWRQNSPECQLILYTSGTDMPPYKSYTSNSFNGGRKSTYIRDRMVELGDIEENAYLHFYNDTKIRNWNGTSWDTVLIPGTYSMVISDGDSVSRVPNSYINYLFSSENTYQYPTRLSPNFTNPNLRQAYVEYLTQAFTAERLSHFPGITGYWDGIYFDNYSPVAMKGSKLVSGGLVVETGTSPSNLLTFATDEYGDWGWDWMVEFGKEVRDTLLTSASWSADGKRKVLAYNVGISNKSIYHFADSSGADALNYEFGFDPVYSNNDSYYRLENLYTRDSIASRNGVTHFWTSPPRRSYGNGSTTKRESIYNNLCFWYTARAESSWVFMRPEPGNAYGVFYNSGFDTLAWVPAMEYELGQPSFRYEVVQTGASPDQAGKEYKVFRREYQYGTVYIRPRDSFDAKWGETSTPITVNLGGQYRKINPDGTLGSVITELQLVGAEGAIVIPAGTGDCGTPPTVPALASPNNGSTVANSQPTLCVHNSTQTDCTQPIRYHFQISTTSDFSSLVAENTAVTEGTGTSCWQVGTTLTGGQTYYWRARSGNGLLWSDWSVVRNFAVTNAPPEAPTLASPLNGGTVSSIQPTLTCNNATDPDGSALTYHFQVATTSTFSSVVAEAGSVSEGGGTTAWMVSTALTNLSTYYWRVRANNGTDYSAWSSSRSFTVNQSAGNSAPTAPTASAPENGATVGSLQPVLIVNNASDPDGDELTYQFEVYNSSQSTLIAQSPMVAEGSSASSWTVSPALSGGLQYYWRVRAFDSQAWSPWMSWVSFTTSDQNSTPTTPVPLTPVDGDTVIGSIHALVTNNSTDSDGDALTYDFVVFSDSLQTKYVEVATEVPEGTPYTSHYTSASFEHGKPFWWKVRAHDGTVWTNWTSPQKFWHLDIALDAEDAPTLVSPDPGAEVIEARPLFTISWSGSTDSTLVYFEISTDPDFEKIVDTGSKLGTNRQASWRPNRDLENGRVYYWRARRENAGFSEASEFSVKAPVFVSPNPFSYYDGTLIFHNLPPGAVVEVFTASGDRVADFQPASSEFEWEVLNSSGERLGPGVYLYYVRLEDEVIKNKFVVVR